ncbi:MAG: metallophosphoesterase [Myxococcota bacterium]
MNPHDARLFVVLVVGFACVLTSALSLGLWFAERRGWLVRSRFAIVSGRLTGGVVLLAFACFLWGVFIEADWLVVTRETVTTPKWPKGKTFRIAHLSDLHVDRNSRALTRLTELLAREQVDLIVFTGDAINELGATKLFRSTLGSLPARFGRVAVRGNHDVYRWKDLDLFGGGVATELPGRGGPLVLEGGALAICGAPFDHYDALPDCIAGAPKGAFVLLAFHTPDLVEALEPRPDLYLAGHTHGGQVAVPFYGALITLSRFDKKYEAGRFEVAGTTLYVNRGIGFEPGFFRVRFAARPELTLIDVVGTQ